MMVFNNEIVVRRNETFTIDKIIQNRDGSPYLISSELQNPHFLITVTNSLYDQKDRYLCNIWCPIDGVLPRFYTTVPVDMSIFKDEYGEQLYTSFDNMGLPQGLVGDDIVAYEPGDALFYFEDDDGNRIYKYWDGSEDEGSWKDYSCRIIQKFTNEITRNWIEGEYFYSIDLVSGELNPNFDVSNGDSRPINGPDELIPILGPTRLTVLSNLKGGTEWA